MYHELARATMEERNREATRLARSRQARTPARASNLNVQAPPPYRHHRSLLSFLFRGSQTASAR
jgi:hypothetical protein